MAVPTDEIVHPFIFPHRPSGEEVLEPSDDPPTSPTAHASKMGIAPKEGTQFRPLVGEDCRELLTCVQDNLVDMMVGFMQACVERDEELKTLQRKAIERIDEVHLCMKSEASSPSPSPVPPPRYSVIEGGACGSTSLAPPSGSPPLLSLSEGQLERKPVVAERKSVVAITPPPPASAERKSIVDGGCQSSPLSPLGMEAPSPTNGTKRMTLMVGRPSITCAPPPLFPTLQDDLSAPLTRGMRVRESISILAEDLAASRWSESADSDTRTAVSGKSSIGRLSMVSGRLSLAPERLSLVANKRPGRTAAWKPKQASIAAKVMGGRASTLSTVSKGPKNGNGLHGAREVPVLPSQAVQPHVDGSRDGSKGSKEGKKVKRLAFQTTQSSEIENMHSSSGTSSGPPQQAKPNNLGIPKIQADDKDIIGRRTMMRSARTAMNAFGALPHGEASSIEFIVKHSYFDVCSAILILLSTATVGAETDYMANHKGETTSNYDIVRAIFFALFFIEWCMRIIAYGRDFLGPEDRSWNVFDTIMVASSILEIVFQTLDTGGAASTGRVLRILRIVRITRAMRIGRILRYARTFRQIAYSLQSSMGTLFWAMVMIFLVVYCFAICFCQAATDFIIDELKNGVRNEASVYREFEDYDSVPVSLFSLYKAMTGGRNWGEVIDPLNKIGWIYGMLFIGFISLTFFGVLNVVTAIFVDSALQSQQHYKDLLIQENVLKKQLYTDHLKQVFKEIDKDNSGCINGDEMEYFLSDPQLNLYLESIDIFPNDARGLFRLLDRDDSGEVSIEEFCEGCLRLKGEAKSFDIHCLIYNTERTHRRVEHIIQYLNSVTRESHHALELE